MKYAKLILIALCPAALWAVDYQVDTLIIGSDILKEERIILIHTSIDMLETDSVKAIYMLDGEFATFRFQKLSKDTPIDAIGIGIVNTDRRRDLLPANGAEKFNQFIEQELIPAIEEKYNCSERILYGHSFGGAFALYSLINKPALFNSYIVSSPTPIMDMVDTEIYVQLDKQLPSNTKLFISYGSSDMRQARKWTAKLIENLTSADTQMLNWQSAKLEGEDHYSAAVPSLLLGYIMFLDQP